jgi:hypothetical protein
MLSSNEQNKISKTQQKKIEQRSKIISLSEANIPASEIAIFTNNHISTVSRTIKKAEQDKTLHDRARSGRPATFSELTQLKITAFFCQFNPLPGCNSITLIWAEQYFKQNPSFLGCAVSASSISRILKAHSLKPHLHKYFLQITDPLFFDKMPSIINLYLNPPKYCFSFDECPGIQALHKVAPPLPAANGERGIKYSEPNHNREGTIDLYSFFDVNSGNVFAKCTPNHQVDTLIEVFKSHVATLPDDAVIHYICDNLSNHSCPDFCKVVADLSGVDYPEKKLDSKIKRQNWLQTENKKIMIHFTPKHGSWLNMVEIWFGILGQKCLKYNTSKDIDELKEFIYNFVETWNKYYAHPFNWKYDGSGLHDQAVKRFIRHIMLENKYMELSFLSNQIELMTNLLTNYIEYVNIKYWHSLAEIIKEKRNFIQNVIENSQQIRLKAKASINFPNLLQLLNDKLCVFS